MKQPVEERLQYIATRLSFHFLVATQQYQEDTNLGKPTHWLIDMPKSQPKSEFLQLNKKPKKIHKRLTAILVFDEKSHRLSQVLKHSSVRLSAK